MYSIKFIVYDYCLKGGTLVRVKDDRDKLSEPVIRVRTVEPPIMDPPTRGQPLYEGHWLWHRLTLL